MHQRLLLILCSILSFVSQAKLQAGFTFYSGFESLQAEYAAGDAKIQISDQLPLIDLVTFPTGKFGSGVQLAPNQWLRIALDQNVSFDQGSLSFWIQPHYTIPDYDRANRTAEQYLFAFNTRTGDCFELKIVNDKNSYLALTLGSNKSNRRTLRYPLTTPLNQSEWYPITVRWQRKSTLTIEAAGQAPQNYTDFSMPDIPEEMGHDLFIGSNADVLIFRRSLQSFDGIIDELKISSQMDQDMSQFPKITPESVPEKIPDLTWLTENAARQIIRIVPQQKSTFKKSPALVELDIKEVSTRSPAQRNQLIKTFRLIRYNDNGIPIPYDTKIETEEKYSHPFLATFDDLDRSKLTLRFNHAGLEPAWYGLYYDFDNESSQHSPMQIPMIGNGEKLRIGDKNSIGQFSAGISGGFDVADFDGDGDWDIWANSGTHFVRRGFDLNYGNFYYDGLAKNTGLPDLVDAPTRVISRNSLTGSISGNTTPCIGDLNGDGKLDVLYYGHSTHEWWELEMVHGKPEIVKIHKLNLTAAPSKREIKVTLYDYNKDGLLDIVTGFMRLNPVTNDPLKPEILHVILNIGSVREPKFDNENPLKINLPDNGDGEWQYSFIDLNNDGLDDILSAGFNTRFFTYLNTGSAKAPIYTNRKQLRTFDGHEIYTPQQLNYARVVDWDHDGDVDILFSGENTTMGLLENIAEPDGPAQFRQTTWIQQQQPVIDAGSLAIPALADIDSDGDLDIIAGNSNPHLYLFENHGDTERPFWGHRKRIEAAGNPIDLRPGPVGSLQSKHENDWGYNNPEVADWTGDGLLDIVAQGNRMDHILFKNIGTQRVPYFARGEQLMLDSEGANVPLPHGFPYIPTPGSLITVHRSRPAMVDWNGDGLMDYVALDSESQFRVYLRKQDEDGTLRLTLGHTLSLHGNHDRAIAIVRTPPEEWTRPGYAGRTVINVADWDGDGDYDIVLNNINARLYENVSGNVENAQFEDRGNLVQERLSAHNVAPELVDWDSDGLLDFFLGTEEGQIYFFSRAYIEHGNLPYSLYPEEHRH
ncbi:FG-GAP-like repeat-containing protein [Coraliomargarita sp. SDUM461004]|uniref:FG-GAP-like repeat-containing protein n=1 Tax=Thalassobacterium sedimentorum TaxID=3041258 RepID=A0ABU1AJ40_9BACT|nr:FG-GAP-like repeat-containing protein [Coraliomargarita sp. SDUM461004]MDQ8193776.1 FG-GAP-like repeat-containing protein [Coraliomargarita sp. SDUM461004]